MTQQQSQFDTVGAVSVTTLNEEKIEGVNGNNNFTVATPSYCKYSRYG
jgi:hypothetical protein